MILLAVGSVGAGAFLIIGQRFEDFLGPVTGFPPTSHGLFTVPRHRGPGPVPGGRGPGVGDVRAGPGPSAARAGGFPSSPPGRILYGDAFNESVLMRPGQWLTRSLCTSTTRRGRAVNTLAAAVGGTSGRARRLQTGFVRSYALSMFFGAAVLVALLLVVRL